MVSECGFVPRAVSQGSYASVYIGLLALSAFDIYVLF